MIKWKGQEVEEQTVEVSGDLDEHDDANNSRVPDPSPASRLRLPAVRRRLIKAIRRCPRVTIGDLDEHDDTKDSREPEPSLALVLRLPAARLIRAITVARGDHQ